MFELSMKYWHFPPGTLQVEEETLLLRGGKKKDKSSQRNNGIVSPTLSSWCHCKWLSTMFWHLGVYRLSSVLSVKRILKDFRQYMQFCRHCFAVISFKRPCDETGTQVISDCILMAKTYQEGWVLSPRHELLLFTTIWSRFTRFYKCSL